MRLCVGIRDLSSGQFCRFCLFVIFVAVGVQGKTNHPHHAIRINDDDNLAEGREEDASLISYLCLALA